MNVEAGSSILSIDENEISYRGRSLEIAAIDGIQYGVVKVHANSLRPSWCYQLGLRDRCNQELHIEFDRFLTFRSTIERNYNDALKGLWPVVTVPIINRLQEAFYTEEGFTVGRVTFNQFGLVRGPFKVFEGGLLSGSVRQEPQAFLPWSEAKLAFANGCFVIAKKSEKKKWALSAYSRQGLEEWASLSLRSTWNAVCLSPVLANTLGFVPPN